MNHHSPLNPPAHRDNQRHAHWSGLYGSASALAIAQFADRQNKLTAVIAGNSKEAETLSESLKFYSSARNDVPVLVFPGWECLPYDVFGPHPDVLSKRIRVLSILPKMSRGFLVVAADTLMQRLPPVEFIELNSFVFGAGNALDVDSFRRRMDAISYRSVQQVEDPGEYVIRGGVIDVFAMGASAPVRIELFGDEIETIRYFDPQTQLSTERIESLEILPGSEIPMTQDGIRSFRQGIRQHLPADPRSNIIYNEIDSNQIPNGAEHYLPLFFPQTGTLLDYISCPFHIFVSENCQPCAEQFWDQVNERFEQARDLPERLPLSPEMLYCAPSMLHELIGSTANTLFQSQPQDHSTCFASDSPAEFNLRIGSANFESILVESIESASARTLICVDSIGQRNLVQNLLGNAGIEHSVVASWDAFLDCSEQVAICIFSLPSGLDLPSDNIRVIASAELFGSRIKQRKKTERQRNPENLIASMEELEIDDLVVHEQYGIGLYKGLITMNVSGADEEFLSIRYRDEQTLYVPVYTIDSLSRYIGADPENVTLNSLSSRNWEKSRKKAKEHAFDLAAELLEIQTLRETRTGNSMPVPEPDYQLLVSRFPYRETPDQEKAITAVLADLHSTRPMDRLVCGDVGFGKTEVALRAALVAVANGFQVAMIVPTTLLAQQHFDVFQDRFAEFGAETRMFSRMTTAAESKSIVNELKSGEIDIAIGTHRLLQQSIEFSNLGLVIIDEEHRFGVRQKEHLKKLRAEVDILTMTATPIPRTLSMALNEIRDISIIATPPDNRLSIRTFVRDWNPGIVREACLRELGRGGQIFYIHNEVKSIQHAAKEISRIVPEADIAIAHGQMPKLQLEHVMKNFYLHKHDLLVCSTIIESGIDIPTANTIIIDRASNFGLAQLHQLRGRVGRSHHQAYAYLLVPSREYLRRDARRRLEAIEMFDQLGMGYVIATHDLEIRGAGALLGESQSGAISEVGYSMYSQILTDSVKALKKSSPNATQGAFALDSRAAAEINLHLSALLPETWIPNVNLRLKLYRRIASIASRSELSQMKAELIDRFGKLPQPVEHLFCIHNLKQWCEQLGIAKLNIGSAYGKIVFQEQADISLDGLQLLTGEYQGTARLNPDDFSLHLTHNLPAKTERIAMAFQILERLSPETVDIPEPAACV